MKHLRFRFVCIFMLISFEIKCLLSKKQLKWHKKPHTFKLIQYFNI